MFALCAVRKKARSNRVAHMINQNHGRQFQFTAPGMSIAGSEYQYGRRSQRKNKPNIVMQEISNCTHPKPK